MIRNPIDIATRVTPRLSALIESRVNDPDASEPPTLGMVREFVTGLLPPTFNAAERMHHFDIGESVIDELNTLIDEFGKDAPAIDFVRAAASEPLSRVIEEVVSDENREGPPTLAAVREAMISGLSARLVGEGVLDEDEDDALLAELESLIERHGEDTLAEYLLRYE
ncbi:hypothetical protein [Sulfuricella sp.]|uniref:hypothetical protein n=1 Tax=Sulfuricella sp. TaxID=2099377 RepID=UPI002D15DAB6|nr:hypothetical protein [Sulfuricella sp.]HUX64095.1 hypothetical protein [Sulfuricella sp.]